MMGVSMLDPVVSRLYSTIDAQVWAEEFMKVIDQKNFQIDTGFMIGWFANAIQTALDHARNERAPAVIPVVPPLNHPSPGWKLVKDDKSHWHYEQPSR